MKIVVLDSSILISAFDPSAAPAPDLEGKAVSYAVERIQYFVDSSAHHDRQILLPTPVIAELLSASNVEEDALTEALIGNSAFLIAGYDQRAAIINAQMNKNATASGNLKAGSEQPRQIVKFDRQILAIAKLHGASAVYCGDKNMAAHARHYGLSPLCAVDMELPPEIIQPDLLLKVVPIQQDG